MSLPPPQLPFDCTALEPHISRQSMEAHLAKHAEYVVAINDITAGSYLENTNLISIVKSKIIIFYPWFKSLMAFSMLQSQKKRRKWVCSTSPRRPGTTPSFGFAWLLGAADVQQALQLHRSPNLSDLMTHLETSL